MEGDRHIRTETNLGSGENRQHKTHPIFFLTFSLVNVLDFSRVKTSHEPGALQWTRRIMQARGTKTHASGWYKSLHAITSASNYMTNIT